MMIREDESRLRGGAIAMCLLLGLLCGCKRGEPGIPLTAPFDNEAVVGRVTATWSRSDEQRSFAEGVRLAEPEVRYRYRVTASNQLADKLFVRLGDFTLVGRSGLRAGSDSRGVECVLAAGQAEPVLQGDVWVSAKATGDIRGFDAAHLAVPLSDVGRGMYRSWLLQGRPDQGPQVDAEIATYAAAPACSAVR